jgi:hypothetical protein
VLGVTTIGFSSSDSFKVDGADVSVVRAGWKRVGRVLYEAEGGADSDVVVVVIEEVPATPNGKFFFKSFAKFATLLKLRFSAENLEIPDVPAKNFVVNPVSFEFESDVGVVVVAKALVELFTRNEPEVTILVLFESGRDFSAQSVEDGISSTFDDKKDMIDFED